MVHLFSLSEHVLNLPICKLWDLPVDEQESDPILTLFYMVKQQFYVCVYFLKKWYSGIKILAQSLLHVSAVLWWVSLTIFRVFKCFWAVLDKMDSSDTKETTHSLFSYASHICLINLFNNPPE